MQTKNSSDQISISEEESLSSNNTVNKKENQRNVINNNINNMLSIYCNKYYDQAIIGFCSITYNNLEILNNFKEQKLDILKNIIKNNLKDKFDITFGHYGSYFTGLSIEESDIDICICYKPKENISLNFYNELLELLKKQKPLIYDINPINSIEMPLFKLEIDITDEINKTYLRNCIGYIDYEDLTRIKIDITFNENKDFLENCEKNVEYVKNEIQKYPQIKPVLLFLKRYFKKMKMNKVFYGGISSYSLFLITLNALKSELLLNKNDKIGISQLLFLVLKKFSTFNFGYKGIGKDNYDYILGYDNFDEKLYILNPLNGINVANGKCRGEKLRKAFLHAYNFFSFEISNFKNYYFYNGFFYFNPYPINSFFALFNTKINFN